jgi:iron complex transport system substrate-binding protein
MRFTARLTAVLGALMFAHAAMADSSAPQRWVSAGGALTEWIVDLGGESRLVGIDTTSQHPQSLDSLPKIGYQRQLSAEGILSLRPDIIVGTEEMGPPPVLEQLRGAGVQVEVFSAKAELPELKQNLQRLGALLGVQNQADDAAKQFEAALQHHHDWVDQAQQHQPVPGVLLLVSHAGAKPMVAGVGTVGDWLINQAGGRNLATHEGYKVFSEEAMAGLNPDVLVFTDRAQPGSQSRTLLFKGNPVLAATRAARDGRLIEIDPTLLVGGLGPRLPDAISQLSKTFYPADPALHAKAPPAK